jgi:hypothetical protein
MGGAFSGREPDHEVPPDDAWKHRSPLTLSADLVPIVGKMWKRKLSDGVPPATPQPSR